MAGWEEDRAKFFVSAVVPSHIFITQPLPPGKKRASQGGRGLLGGAGGGEGRRLRDLLKRLDDPEYQRVAGPPDERRPCPGPPAT